MQNWLFLCYYSVQSIASFTYLWTFSENHELSSHILYKAHIGGAWFSAKSHQLQAEHYKRKILKISKHYKVKIFSTLYMGFLFYRKIWCADARDLENMAWTKFVTQENFSEKEKRRDLTEIKLNSRRNLIREKEKQERGKRNGIAKWNIRCGIVSVSAPLSPLFTSQQVTPAVIPAREAITEITKFSKSGAN